jgi:hypothetical protein
MADAPSRWPQFAQALRKQALMDEMMGEQGGRSPRGGEDGLSIRTGAGELPRLRFRRHLPRLVPRGRKRAS